MAAPLAVNKLLHSLTYLIFFQVNNCHLENNTKYSIEDLCSMLGGLVGHDAMHKFLTNVGSFSHVKEQCQSLHGIIMDPLLFEILIYLNVDVSVVTGALCAAWCIISEKKEHLEELDKIRHATNKNLYEEYYTYITEKIGG